MDNHDLEKGLGEDSSTSAHASTPQALSAEAHPSTSRNPHFGSELAIFQGLVGIHYLKEGGEPWTDRHHEAPVNPLLAVFFPSKTAKARQRNRGMYKRAVTQDAKNRSMYAITHYIISGLYIFQVLVAATLTALSAYGNTSTVSLTVLGAINTAIAGLLAWLTGQGMPTRYRRARDPYREVIRHIEAMERRFAQINYVNWPEGRRPDPVLERDKIAKMFEDARKDQEANYPDTTQTPLADQRDAKNDELNDELIKWKTKKKDQEMKFAQMKADLEEAKASMRAGFTGGKAVMEEIIS
ncbi:hypothetical protein CLAFUW4_13738 [Fulvia fulva]|uniref:SMODS and SLOG-associating 2TM effector domain-containing protein n=1 Tax=Passalora fulva TaxID=5499 RepID=A0A9Q8PKG9_PASFU|nr:uncharacterized protein CLAFUR5_13586 [Fulvia fulva]KAK4610104.1 hypothetical protein CLAFUR4_13741 [Fulvia fulva]KAK4610996.1 hypothetical protein CLAFUR0_13745 [Fulvia fulva]UJO24171.1 hypothetical protein CLAFUR5_13586 [Fulvia fulva]WPV22157.1 hypothetical protein CLAFUW4_13738 [Fulvia fulva]WPV37295.1 hypothetical protein CLAFUW7_13746 [Fulvia fulva]